MRRRMKRSSPRPTQRRTQRADVEWEVLEITEGEWGRQFGATGTPGDERAWLAARQSSTRQAPRVRTPGAVRRPRRRLAVSLAGALVAVLAIAVGLWFKAEQGIAAMEREVKNTIHVEGLRQEQDGSVRQYHSVVQHIAFNGSKALAQVVVTETLPSGMQISQRQAQFYVQTPSGWQRTTPAAEFWGEERRLDTPTLHFVYHELDREAVEQLAAGADAFNVRLHTLLNLPLAQEHTTIVVTPAFVLPHEARASGMIRLTSPMILNAAPDQPPAVMLAGSLRRALVDTAYETARARAKPGEQWMIMAEGVHSWLLAMPFAPIPLGNGPDWLAQTKAVNYVKPHLTALVHCHPCDPGYIYRVENTYGSLLQWDMAPRLVNFLVARFGSRVVARLFAGFGAYGDWDALAPAVLGVPAQQLEAEWQGAPDGAWPP